MLDDLRFLLEDVLQLPDLLSAPRFAGHDLDDVHDVLTLADTLAREIFAPLAPRMDAQEPQLVDGRVKLPDGVKDALDAYLEAGFQTAALDAEHGGMQLPYVVASAFNVFFGAANTPLLAYTALSQAAANLLAAHGTEAQRETWMKPLVEGRFHGTMALSETQAGSSLADLSTLATPQPDGSYRLVGNKMWITATDHDLGENIVNLVLARTPGAPPGTRGISLFVVPQFLPDEDGGFTVPNDVRVVGLNHKLGFRGAVNTVWALGDEGGATGWRIGEEGRGLTYMFHMMNEARTAVGLGAASMAWAGFHHSLAYAKERPQGRPITQRDPTAPQVPIVAHADVRRMLLEQKALAEGGLWLALFAAGLVDRRRIAQDAGDDREAGRLGLLLDVLTPIVKAWCSEQGVRANDTAIQVLGGYGYTRDYAAERLWRDNRLNPIHEGTNGIQGLDLLGRKVFGKGGGAVLLGELQKVVAEASGRPDLARPLGEALTRVVEVTTSLGAIAQSGDVERFLANSTVYLRLVGHTVVAAGWVRQVLALGDRDDTFARGKRATATHFLRWELPRTAHWASLLSPVEDTPLRCDPDWL